MATVSAASGALSVAPGSIVSGFGQGLATTTVGVAQVPLPVELAGTSVRVKGSDGLERAAPLFFVSPRQANFLIPEGTKTGLGSVTVTVNAEVVATGTVGVEDVAPGIFTANASGQGVAAAFIVRVAPDGTQTTELVFDSSAPLGERTALPMDFGPEGDRLFLVLFGTGMRGATTGATATVGGRVVDVADPVAQGQFIGLDQVNLGPLPRALGASGEVDILVAVDGKQANTVTVRFQGP